MPSTGKLVGDWNRTDLIFVKARVNLNTQAREVLRECAEIYLKAVFELITEGGDPSWRALSPKWVRRKGHEHFYLGLSGQFKQKGIIIRELENTADTHTLLAGVDTDQVHQDSQMKMGKLATVLQATHERALFGPAWERVKPIIEKKLKTIGAKLFE